MSKYSLKDKRFGNLIVLRENGRSKQGDVMWLCKCDCGNNISVRACSLVSGNTRSCGCIHKRILSIMGKMSKLDLIGQRFGKLVVISETNEKTRCGHYKWLCRCDCGNEKLVAGNSLKSGNVRSCGCISTVEAMHKKNTKGVLKYDLPLYDIYKEQLYCEDIFVIEEEDLDLLGVKCAYCGRIFRPSRT